MPKASPVGKTPSRKKQHVDLTIRKDVSFQHKSTGLDELEFIHNALPELDLSEVNTSAVFLGKNLRLPLMISCMTGGYTDALRINREIATVCEEFGIAMGVGSQRQALESKQFHKTFSIAREVAPSIPIVGNIGAAEVAGSDRPERFRFLIELARADALAVHLNPLQEFLQPEGNPRFRGVLKGIGMLVKEMDVPIVVKEIGAGLSADVILRLLDVGVQYIDVAGAGGTSWAGVESLRRARKDHARSFWDWGIPTATAIRDAARLKSRHPFTLLASGGIVSGIDAGKCIALGADIVATARPALQTLERGGKRGLHELLNRWTMELKGVMFLTGSSDLRALGHATLSRDMLA